MHGTVVSVPIILIGLLSGLFFKLWMWLGLMTPPVQVNKTVVSLTHPLSQLLILFVDVDIKGYSVGYSFSDVSESSLLEPNGCCWS